MSVTGWSIKNIVKMGIFSDGSFGLIPEHNSVFSLPTKKISRSWIQNPKMNETV